MKKNTTHPDTHYERHPLETLQYCDALYASLVKGVPDFYYAGGWDSTFYGTILRGISREQSRLELTYHYDMSRNPETLTPADACRRFAYPLYINKNYPGVTQFDTAYKQMVLDLREAYRKGATVKALGEVIKAYTGQVFQIDEMFKFIGSSSVVDETDRNSLKINVHSQNESHKGVGKIDSQALLSYEYLKLLTDDLYHAVDLAKPAHVGINLTTLFGMDEDFSSLISGIEESIRVFALIDDLEPGDEALHLARHYPTTPDTGLNSAYRTPFRTEYQWFKDHMGIITRIEGAATAYLTLKFTTPMEMNTTMDGDRFFCIATVKDAAGEVIKENGLEMKTRSASAQIRVRPNYMADTLTPDPAMPAPPGTINPELVFKYQPMSVTVDEPLPNKPDNISTLQAIAEYRGPYPGALSPKIDHIWEIQSDEFQGADLE